MNKLYVIRPKIITEQLTNMLSVFLSENSCIIIDNCTDLPDLQNKQILFLLELNSSGTCPELLSILDCLCERGADALSGSIAGVLVHSKTDLFTKSSASHLVFIANSLGCAFIGHPVIEATGSLSNFITWQKTLPLSLEDICLEQCNRLKERLLQGQLKKFDQPRIVALHASSRKTSNTLMLWSMVKDRLHGCSVEEHNVENGTVHDCIGCSFTTCTHYSKQNSCFYGGQMVQEIVPAIEKADALVMICPNYNDAISANLTAVINRTTALYRKMSFHDKYLFSVVVSGNSGGDSVARQLLNALNINKGFALAPYSILLATANDPGAINLIENIYDIAEAYANNILSSIKASSV